LKYYLNCNYQDLDYSYFNLYLILQFTFLQLNQKLDLEENKMFCYLIIILSLSIPLVQDFSSKYNLKNLVVSISFLHYKEIYANLLNENSFKFLSKIIGEVFIIINHSCMSQAQYLIPHYRLFREL